MRTLPSRSWREIGRLLVISCIVVATALVVASCSSSSDSSSSSSDTDARDAGPVQRGGTLKLASAVEPTSLDPALGLTDPGSQHAQVLIFDRLVSLDPGSTEVGPGLAESWKFSGDKKRLTFNLRDAKFSDGTPVTSEDVKFSLERASDEQVDPLFGASLKAMMPSILAPDPKTVVIELDGPQPALLPYLNLATTSIVNKKVFERLGAKRFAVAPIDGGSGPFKVVKWSRGRNLELAKNPNYWRKGLPYLDGVDMLYVPDDNTRLLDLRAGRIDVADDVPYSQLNAIESAPGVRLQVTEIASVFGPWLSGRGPLEDVKVRQALNYATPKEAIKKVVLQGRGEIANSFIPRMKYWDESIEAFPYDVDKAKELIASSDQPDGFDLELLIQSGDAVGRQAAAILQDSWKKVGVNLNIRAVDGATLSQRVFGGDYLATLPPPNTASSDIPTEDEFAVNLTQPSFEQPLGHEDPKLRALIKQITGTYDEEERRKLFSEFQRRLYAENPIFVPIATVSARTALRDNVHGFDYVLVNWLALDKTWIAK